MKRKMRMGWMVAMTLLAMFSFVALDAYADTISGNQVVVKANDVETTYDLDKVKLEVEDGRARRSLERWDRRRESRA